MEIGMLWFDGDAQSDLHTKVKQAADYYQKKYGQEPNLCFVHPAMLKSAKEETGPIKICPNKLIIQNHFWIGIQTAD
jgi:hypothetical protein